MVIAMGCCNSFNSIELGVALQEVAKSRDAEDFADVSLGSHSESNASMAQDTHPVYLMNSVFLFSPDSRKRRSITVPDPGLSPTLTTPKFGDKSNTRSASYCDPKLPDTVRSTKTSGSSSFHAKS